MIVTTFNEQMLGRETKVRWIKYIQVDLRDGRKTKVWAVLTKDGRHVLGRIGWYSPWRRYVFVPTIGVQIILEQDCMRDIADFCEQSTQARKLERQTIKERTP